MIPFFRISSHPPYAWKSSIISLLANSRAFSLSRSLWTGTFPQRKNSKHILMPC